MKEARDLGKKRGGEQRRTRDLGRDCRRIDILTASAADATSRGHGDGGLVGYSDRERDGRGTVRGRANVREHGAEPGHRKHRAKRK